MTESTNPDDWTDEFSQDVAQALRELPVWEHGPSFWPMIDAMVDAQDVPAPYGAAAVTDTQRSPAKVAPYFLAVAAVVVVLLAAALFFADQRSLSTEPVGPQPQTVPEPRTDDGRPPADLDLVEGDQVTGENSEADLPFDIEGVDVTDRVAEFTSQLEPDCCPDRTANIHLMAELTQGVIIRPGATFSLNNHVGRRTEEGGFFTGPVVVDGKIRYIVGAGVSHYATTLFNAALLAGLDIVEHASHDVYFSRYPLGLDASIGWPGPDLVIANPTGHDVVIWNSYSDQDVSVALFSKPSGVVVELGEPRESRDGGCLTVVTTRTRTWPDGSAKRDEIVAAYATNGGPRCER